MTKTINYNQLHTAILRVCEDYCDVPLGYLDGETTFLFNKDMESVLFDCTETEGQKNLNLNSIDFPDLIASCCQTVLRDDTKISAACNSIEGKLPPINNQFGLYEGKMTINELVDQIADVLSIPRPALGDKPEAGVPSTAKPVKKIGVVERIRSAFGF